MLTAVQRIPPMIVAHSRRFVFIKTRKTAGSSLEAALREVLDAGDVVTPIGQLADGAGTAPWDGPPAANYQYGPWVRRLQALLGARGKKILGYPHHRFHAHMPARRVRAKIGRRAWAAYFKVSIVRNPYDMLVSLYVNERTNGRLPAGMDFASFVHSGYVRPRNVDLLTVRGRLAMDMLLRYEHLQADARALGEVLGVGRALADRLDELQLNAGQRARPQVGRFYTESLRRYVAWRFADEFALFGYDPELLPEPGASAEGAHAPA